MNGVRGVRHLEPTTASAADEKPPARNATVGAWLASSFAEGCRKVLTTANQSLVESIAGPQGLADDLARALSMMSSTAGDRGAARPAFARPACCENSLRTCEPAMIFIDGFYSVLLGVVITGTLVVLV